MCLDHGFTLLAAEFSPKGRHDYAKCGHVVLPAAAPDVLGDVLVGKHFVGVFRKKAQLALFSLRQVQFILIQEYCVRSIIDLQAGVHIYGGFFSCQILQIVQAPECDTEPGEEFFHREWFCDIVVRPCIKGSDLVRVVAARTDYQDRCL